MLHKSDVLSKIEGIPGWLNPPAAQLALWMLQTIERNKISGNLLEIGVFKGKFLALMRSASREKILGINISEPEWAGSAVKEILSNVENSIGTKSDIEILIADSTTLTATDLRSKIGPLKFAHIDGGHDAKTVYHDLTITAPLLQPGGVLVMDDAFNFALPGVIEGVCRFFDRDGGKIAPFAHCYNKLFATTADYHGRYLESARQFLDAVVDEEVAKKTKQRIAENAAVNFKTEFAGFETLIFI